jgi:hypothetical protein
VDAGEKVRTEAEQERKVQRCGRKLEARIIFHLHNVINALDKI